MTDFNLADFDMKDMEAESAALNKAESRAMDNYVKMPEKEGYVILRLLPALKGKSFFVATRIHRLGQASYHCSRVRTKTQKGIMWLNESNNPKDDCPICQEYSRLWKVSNNQHGDQQARTQAEARSLKPIERYYWNAIVRQQVGRNGAIEKNIGPKIYSCGKIVQTIIADNMAGNETTGVRRLGNVLHPIEGRDFRLVKKISKGNGNYEYPNYAQSTFDEVSVLGTEEQIKIWLSDLPDLESLRDVKPREVLITALRDFQNGGAESQETWDEPASAPAPSMAKKEAPKQQPKSAGIDIEGLDLSDVSEDLKNLLGD
jgi:hypothetical protein